MNTSSQYNSLISRYYLLLIGILASLLLTSCGGPRITVVWSEPKAALQNGTIVRYQSIDLGKVVKTTPAGTGVEVQIELQKGSARYVKTETTFLVREASGSSPAYIEVIPVKLDSEPAVDGARFQGSNSDLGAKLLVWTTDWKRTAIYVGIALAALIVLLIVGKILLNLWILIACVAGGLAGATFLTPIILPHIAQMVPVDIRPDIIAYLAAFGAGYVAAMVILSILRAPFRSSGG